MDSSLPGSSIHGISQARIWSGLPFPSPGDLPDPGIEPKSPTLQADSLPSEPAGKPHELHAQSIILKQYTMIKLPLHEECKDKHKFKSETFGG